MNNQTYCRLNKLIFELDRNLKDTDEETLCLKSACKNFLEYFKQSTNIQSIHELSLNHLKKMAKTDNIETILSMTTYFSDSRRNVLKVIFHYYSPCLSEFDDPDILTAADVQNAIENEFFIDPISGYSEPNFKKRIIMFFILTDDFKRSWING